MVNLGGKWISDVAVGRYNVVEINQRNDSREDSMVATLFGGIGGLALSISGGGGAILILPLFVYLFHVSVHKALLLSLAMICFSAFIGSIPNRRWSAVERKIVFLVALGGLLMVPLGTYTSFHISEQHLLLVFSMVMAATAIFIWLKDTVIYELSHHSGDESQVNEQFALRWYWMIAFGAIAGFLSGLLGIGAGLLLVPALALSLMMPVSKASKLSLLVVMVISLAGIISHLSYHVIDGMWLISFVFGGSIGLMIGGRLSRFLPEKLTQRIAAVIILSLAIAMLAVSL